MHWFKFISVCTDPVPDKHIQALGKREGCKVYAERWSLRWYNTFCTWDPAAFYMCIPLQVWCAENSKAHLFNWFSIQHYCLFLHFDRLHVNKLSCTHSTTLKISFWYSINPLLSEWPYKAQGRWLVFYCWRDWECIYHWCRLKAEVVPGLRPGEYH